MLATVLVGWFAQASLFAGVKDSQCASEGASSALLGVADYASKHSGRLPTSLEQLEPWCRTYPECSDVVGGLTCPLGAFVWPKPPTRIASGHVYPVLGFPENHGLFRKYRNVVFSDLALRRVPARFLDSESLWTVEEVTRAGVR